MPVWPISFSSTMIIYVFFSTILSLHVCFAGWLVVWLVVFVHMVVMWALRCLSSPKPNSRPFSTFGNTFFMSASLIRMYLLSLWSWSPLSLKMAHIFLTTWVLGITLCPTMAANLGDSFTSAVSPVTLLAPSLLGLSADLSALGR